MTALLGSYVSCVVHLTIEEACNTSDCCIAGQNVHVQLTGASVNSFRR